MTMTPPKFKKQIKSRKDMASFRV